MTINFTAKTVLKSDHFGIEIRNTVVEMATNTKLKSDHFGIEIQNLTGKYEYPYAVKIRPFWD